MSATQGILLNEEWRRLKLLRSHRHRLRNTTRYQKLDRSRLLSAGIGAQNDASLLEDGLRNVMTRNDLDTLFDHGLDADAQDQVSASLTSLCATLESIVATNLWTEQVPEIDSEYPNIDRLLDLLGSTEWQFHMATAPRGRKLFITTDLKSTKAQVDSFNNLFSRLTQPDIGELEPHGGKAAEREQVSGARDQLQKATQSLQRLLSWLSTLTGACRGYHDVLLQLPEWDVASSRGHFRTPHLDLCLSRSCYKPSESGLNSLVWQESRLRETADGEAQDWYAAGSLCEEIEYSCSEKLTLAAAEDNVLVYAGPTDGAESPTIPIGTSSRTLKQLIQDGALLGPSRDWPSEIIFEPAEKRTLAAALVLGFSLTFDDVRLIKCWDADSIHFLSDSNGRVRHSLPYALCLTSAPIESTAIPSIDDNEREARFARLARLLMEIKCGHLLEHKQIMTSGHLQANADTFEKYLSEQSMLNLCESNRWYLIAVQKCLNFKNNCRREYNRMTAHGDQGGQDAAARNVTYGIVQMIHKAAAPPLHPSRKSDRRSHPPGVDYSLRPSVSSHPEQLGISNGSPDLSPMTATPHGSSNFIVHKKPPTSKRKQVKFIDKELEDSKEVKDESMAVGAPVVNPVTRNDDCELFGNVDAQEHPKDLRNATEKWMKDFKKLRTKKTGVSSKQRIKVAVLDTGVDITHPNIKGNISGHKSFVDDDATVDRSGHGTHIAGVILNLTTNVDLYIGKVIASRKSENRRPIVEALIHARDVWKVDMISLSFGFRVSNNRDLVREEIEACLKDGIIVFASASNDAGNKPRTHPGDYDGVLCIHSATWEGNASTFSPSPVPREDNFSFVGDCIKSDWPMKKHDFDGDEGVKYLSGTSIATPVAVSVAIFMLNYIKKELGEYHWNIKPWSPKGMRKIFAMMAHTRAGYDWVSPEWFFSGDQNHEETIKAKLKSELIGYIP